MSIPIVKRGNPVTYIAGFVDDKEVLVLNNHIMRKWHVASSTCLPADVVKARQMVDCYSQCFAEMESLQ